MIYNKDEIKNTIKGKRLLGVDFGLKRIGLAVSDELGITTTPLTTLDFSKPEFWQSLQTIISREKIAACVVGIPYFDKSNENSIIYEINSFIDNLKDKFKIDVFTFDESFTSNEAITTMISIGKKKKKRATKGEKDKIAAAIILRNFLDYYID